MEVLHFKRGKVHKGWGSYALCKLIELVKGKAHMRWFWCIYKACMNPTSLVLLTWSCDYKMDDGIVFGFYLRLPRIWDGNETQIMTWNGATYRLG